MKQKLFTLASLKKLFLLIFFVPNIVGKNEEFIMSQKNTESVYSQVFVDLVEFVYGEGFLSQGGEESVDFMLEGIDLDGKKILDIGSGLGGVDFYLAKKHAVDIIGVDTEDFIIERARERLAKIAPKLKGSVQFLSEGPHDYLKQFDDETFDIVFSKETILHIPLEDKITYFQQVNRILKKGGKIVIMDWMHTTGDYSKDLQWMIETDGIPYNLVTLDQYKNILSAANFKNVQFINTTEENTRLSKEDCETVRASKDELEKKFGKDVYEEYLESWIMQWKLFESGELVTGIFKAEK